MRTVPEGAFTAHPFLWTQGIAARETLRYLDREAVDAEPVLSQAGISRAQLLQGGTGVTVASQYQFLELAAAHVNDPLLGLHVATEMDVRRAGLLYYLAASSATVFQALDHLTRYSRTVIEAVAFELLQRTDETVLTVLPMHPYEPRRQYREFISLVVVKVLRALTGRAFSPSRITFTHVQTSDARKVERLLGCPVEFAHSEDSWVFPERVMQFALASSDGQLLELLRAHADNLLAGKRTASRLQDVVERQVLTLLPGGSAHVAAVAQQIGMSTRSLTRRLAEEGATFREIVDRLRKQMALSYLADARLSLQQIAWLLGYSEIGAFNHAFKRWTGNAPGRVRDHHSLSA
jgi:AraC-like DNA-binding protein